MDKSQKSEKLKGTIRHALGAISAFVVGLGFLSQTDAATAVDGINGIVAGVLGLIGVAGAFRASWKSKEKM